MSELMEISDAAVVAAEREYEAFGATMRDALVAARPYLMPTRDALVVAMNSHPIEAFNGSQVVCECNLTWQTNAEYRAHLADAVLALLNGAES